MMEGIKEEASYKNVMSILNLTAQKEKALWKSYAYSSSSPSGDDSISHTHRSEVIRWLILANDRLGFHVETVFHAVSILDQFLALVKAKARYLRCIAISCLYLSAKIKEESEDLPTTLELVRISECGCSVSELVRMERCILNKFMWNISAVTSFDFLHIIYALFMEECKDVVAEFGTNACKDLLHYLELKLLRCLTSHEMLQLPPSTIAMTAICIELERYCPNVVVHLVSRLACFVQIDASHMKLFQHSMTRLFTRKRRHSAALKSLSYRSRSTFSNVCTISSISTLPLGLIGDDNDDVDDDDDVYEGIRQMYEAYDQMDFLCPLVMLQVVAQ